MAPAEPLPTAPMVRWIQAGRVFELYELAQRNELRNQRLQPAARRRYAFGDRNGPRLQARLNGKPLDPSLVVPKIFRGAEVRRS